MKIHARQAMKGALITLLNRNLQSCGSFWHVTDLTEDFETATVVDGYGEVSQIKAELLIPEETTDVKIITEVKNTGIGAEAVDRVRKTRINFAA